MQQCQALIYGADGPLAALEDCWLDPEIDRVDRSSRSFDDGVQ